MQSLIFQVTDDGIGMTKLHKPVSKPKNYLNENLKRVQQIEQMAKLKAAEKEQPPKQVWKSKRFDQVPSRLKKHLQEPPTPRPSSGKFLRAHSRSGPPVKLSDCSPAATPKEIPIEKLTIQPVSQMPEVKSTNHDIDFIKLNGRATKNLQPVRPASSQQDMDYKKKQNKELRNYKKGQVPKYLKERQIQWEREERERLANLPDPTIPAGHRVLPENERVETLSLLKKNEADLLQQIQKLPLSNDSLRAQRWHQQLETKLAEVDEAIKIFSRPKVFVKIE